MKKLALSLLILCFALTVNGQINTNKKMEQMFDEYCVQTVTVLNRTFNVGDTIYFLNGSSPMGDYLCSSIYTMSPGNSIFAMAITGTTYDIGEKKYLGVEYTGKYIVITKIRNFQEGSDQRMVQLINVLSLAKNQDFIICIDPVIGFERKEIK